jgi:hypothetical protein
MYAEIQNLRPESLGNCNRQGLVSGSQTPAVPSRLDMPTTVHITQLPHTTPNSSTVLQIAVTHSTPNNKIVFRHLQYVCKLAPMLKYNVPVDYSVVSALAPST